MGEKNCEKIAQLTDDMYVSNKKKCFLHRDECL